MFHIKNIGARAKADGSTSFNVWAPNADSVEVVLLDDARTSLPMIKSNRGYWQITCGAAPAGTRYLYRLNHEIERPDPASHYQPDGVHGASEVVDHAAFSWHEADWSGLPLAQYIIYEIHVGTFTHEGTFDAIIPRLDALRELGITAIELMPVAQFPGERNWGYDGAYTFAVQDSYGGPTGLKRLVAACHKRGLVVVLDVVYNHFGPEGCYVRDFGPFFTDKYQGPWGAAINFDGPHSDEVRTWFIENALHWLEHYHIDALRLDAIHGIYDLSAHPFLQELREAVDEYQRQRNREFYLIAESDLNDSRVIKPYDSGGYGLDAQWSDDFHHSVHALCTGERFGYYRDFGAIKHLATAMKRGYVYAGAFSAFRQRRHGNNPDGCRASQFVVCSQNHDQVGNRACGERLSTLVPFPSLKVIAGAYILSLNIPLLFMGEEYGETSPFLYFIDHSDESLVAAVQEGRRREFEGLIGDDVPDPKAVDTFEASRLSWDSRDAGQHRALLQYYTRLIQLRSTVPALQNLDFDATEAIVHAPKSLLIVRKHADGDVWYAMNFDDEAAPAVQSPCGRSQLLLDSNAAEYGGECSAALQIVEDESEIELPPFTFIAYTAIR